MKMKNKEKIRLNPLQRRIIGQTKKWVIQGGIIVPFTGVIPAEALTYVMKRLYPSLPATKLIVIAVDRGDRAYWIYDEEEFIRHGQWCLKHPEYIKKVYKRWKIFVKNYYEQINRLERQGLKSPINDFLSFYRAYLNEYSLPLITEYYSLAGDHFIRQLLAKYGHASSLIKDIIQYSQPPKITFLQEAELALVNLAVKLAQVKLPQSLSSFKKKWPKFYLLLKKIRKHYFWIRFSYRDTKPLTLTYFYQRIRQLKKKGQKSLLKRQKELIGYRQNLAQQQKKRLKKTLLTAKERQYLKAIGFAAAWQDDRKRANLWGNYECNRFLSYFAKKYRYHLIDLQHLIPPELISLIRGGKLKVRFLKSRLRGCLYYVFPDHSEGVLIGEEFRQVWRMIKEMNYPYQAKELKGIAASPGVYRGRVKKIESPGLEGKKLKHGDVLLTYMTRPDFVHLIPKAGAIVTDEGGLTSHAAIISREFKIPCLVGTRFAMRLFKDRDLVEVDAFKGVIRKL